MLKIVLVPNKVLTTPVLPVETIDKKIVNLVEEMKLTLLSQHDPQGVGLAAPQVGVNLAIFIIKPTQKSKIEVFINPKIIDQIRLKPFVSNTSSKPIVKKGTPLEGCLSIPRIWSPVKRDKKILLEYQTMNGEKKTEWFKGFKAVIIQHEVDHLDGILFTQRSLEQNSPLFEEKDGELEKLKY
ncbi:peptide deformylase [Candidatus Roizmanbacteria bacterium]|jgi:peptide deformylase|nr:peptide deformylase [Candidatus Roizmanbacteria bacterium]